MIHSGNFKMELPEDVQDGDTFDNFNLTQRVSRQITDKTGLTFRNGNLTNCQVPPDSVVESSCLHIQKDFCYWLHLDMGLENLPTYSGAEATCGPDVENCRHVDEDLVYEIIIEGGSIDIYDESRKDQVL